jgi:hypothetical protein
MRERVSLPRFGHDREDIPLARGLAIHGPGKAAKAAPVMGDVMAKGAAPT